MNKRFFILCFAALLPLCGRGADSAPAVAVFDESLGLAAPGSDRGPRLRVEIWPDGRIIWSRDQRAGGPPFLSARIEPQKVQALLDRFERERVFDSKSFRHSWFGPDSSFTTIWLESTDRHTRLQSWHEGFEAQPHLVALSSGVTSLNGRTREDALRTDTKEYQRFRQIWSDLRGAIAALVPKHGDPYTGSTALKLPK
jgi:hypothetical protein